MGAGAPTPITVQLSLHCVQLRQLIERSAFVRSGRHGSSYLEHGSPAESRIVAGAAVLVENGAPATCTSDDTKASAIARRQHTLSRSFLRALLNFADRAREAKLPESEALRNCAAAAKNFQAFWIYLAAR